MKHCIAVFKKKFLNLDKYLKGGKQFINIGKRQR